MEISPAAETLFDLGPLPVTNALLTSWIVTLALIIFAFFAGRKIRMIPTSFQNFVEIVIEGLFNLFDSVTQEKKLTKKFFPIVATIFIFVLCANWTEILPGLGSIGIWEEAHGGKILVSFLRAPSADLNFTLAIAISSVIMIQIFGIALIGFFKYIKKFLNFRGPVQFFVGILEMISEIAKIVSFSLRLFGNIFAGEVLLLVIAFLIPFIAPLPFYLLEIFVGFVQALIFSMLTLVFLTMAAKVEAH